MDKFFHKYWSHLVTAGILVITILAAFFVPITYVTELVKKSGPWAPVIYILIQWIGQVLAPVSTSPLFIAGYKTFGKASFIYHFVIGVMASVSNFLIARKFGLNFIQNLLGDKIANEIEDLLTTFSNRSLVILRLSTFFINDVASYAFGLTEFSFWQYLITSMLSQIPWYILTRYVIFLEKDTTLMLIAKFVITLILFSIVTQILFFKTKKDGK